jgi:hypothetical protein
MEATQSNLIKLLSGIPRFNANQNKANVEIHKIEHPQSINEE